MTPNRAAIFTTDRLYLPYTMSAYLRNTYLILPLPLPYLAFTLSSPLSSSPYHEWFRPRRMDPDPHRLASPDTSSIGPPSTFNSLQHGPWPIPVPPQSPGHNRTILATTYRSSSDQLTPLRFSPSIPARFRRSRMKTEIEPPYCTISFYLSAIGHWPLRRTYKTPTERADLNIHTQWHHPRQSSQLS
jgi:hypothetical protein